tara:strand:- start:4231 stop:4863 length:633 start_codon:yes stop_codon:yes gene_type:complete
MEDLEPEQIEELKQKAIERVESEPETAPPKKSKKIRSQAQKEAFERAKLKRAANIKLRQKLKEEEKALKKQTKIKITQRVKEELEQPKEEEVEPAEPQPKLVRQKSSVVEPQPYHHHQPAPVNNYYYYGAPPVGPQHHYESEGGWLPPKRKEKKRGKKVRPPTPSSSEEEQSDVDEPETYKDLHSNIVEPEPEYEPPPQTKIPQFKFGFA